jgi:hypothetical protein
VDAARSIDQTDPIILRGKAGEGATRDEPLLLRGKCVGNGVPDSGCTQAAALKTIVIESSEMSAIPENVRVIPSDATKLYRFTLTGSQPGVIIVPPEITGIPGRRPPSHYILRGLELYSNSINPGITGVGGNYGGVVNIGLYNDGFWKANKNTGLPHTVTVDRCYLHGQLHSSWTRPHMVAYGVRADGNNITVKNSYIADLHRDHIDWGHGETAAIFGSNGQGPWYITNNHIDAAIGSLAGGEHPWVAGAIFTGYFAFGNNYTRDPNVWTFHDGASPGINVAEPCVSGAYYKELTDGLGTYDCMGGTWVAGAARAKMDWTKNGWECKNCRLAVAEGNYVHDIPDTWHGNQHGHAFLINNVDPDTGNANYPYARPEHGIIRFNRVKRTGQGLIMGRLAGTNVPPVEINNWKIEHNLMTGIASPLVAPSSMVPGQILVLFTYQQHQVTVRNNTMLHGATAGYGYTISASPGAATALRDHVIKDNILGWPPMGHSGAVASESCSLFRAQFQGLQWDYWAVIDTFSRGQTMFNNIYNQAGCPMNKGRQIPSEAGFVSYSDGINGNYRLCTGAGTPDPACAGISPLATAASDGGPLGADIQQVTYATSGVEAGTADYDFWHFQIRRAEEAEIRYTAYSSAACSGVIRDAAGSVVDSWVTDGGGNNRERTYTPVSLSAGEYIVRVTCAGRWKEETFRAY